MIIQNIKMYNFRCFEQKELEFKKGINILVGMNATGKTSILEGVYFLCLSKSFKTSDELQMIRIGQDELSVVGWINKEGFVEKFSACKNIKGKQIFKNDNKYLRISDYVGENLVVSFSSTDLNKLLGYSRDRRKILEPILCQISNFYVKECNYYNKVLNERNALLKRLTIEKKEEWLKLLEILNAQLAESAKKIIFERKEFVNLVNQKIEDTHYKISGSDEKLQLEYLPNVTEDLIEKRIKESLEQDLKKGTTTVGPHKDDFVFVIDGKNVVDYGSQGQQRNALISAKITFLEILKDLKGENPVLLLDDVFSELDKKRQNNLLKNVDSEAQVIISTATLAEVDKNILDNANIINIQKEEIRHGRVKK